MGDLMKEAVSYLDLQSKYENFYVPNVKIKINGMDSSAKFDFTIHEVEAVLSLNTASSVVIKLVDIYDTKTRSFESKVKAAFKLGTIVEVEMGYMAATEKIFKGYVAMIGVEFNECAMMVITLMDVRRLMMINGTKQVLHNVKNYSDAYNNIMAAYKGICSTDVDATTDNLNIPISQMSNDYDFVVKELIETGKADREFFVFADKAYFREPGKIKAPIMTVQYFRELIQFQVSECYLDLNVEVVGYNSLNQEAVTAKATVKSTQKQNVLFTEKPTMTITHPEAFNTDKAQTVVDAAVRKRVGENCRGSGITVGIPELVPGRYLQVERTDSLADKKYYLTEVTHILGKEGYETHFEIGGSI